MLSVISIKYKIVKLRKTSQNLTIKLSSILMKVKGQHFIFIIL